MRSRLTVSLLAILLALFAGGCWQMRLPKAKVVVQVVDESGKPMSDVEVRGSFSDFYQANHPAKFTQVTARTDSNGVVAFSEKTMGSVSWLVRQPGYYPYRDQTTFSRGSIFRWQPWGQTNVAVLKRIIKPIAMLRGGGTFRLPRFGQPCGFDLERKDWVVPYGKGSHTDFIFTGTNRFVVELDRETDIKLTFPNLHDGIIPLDIDMDRGSELRTPRHAPESGYVSELRLWERVGGGQPTSRSYEINGLKRAYFIRVRSELDVSGNLKRAWYGTILSEFEVFSISPDTVRIRFSYYLNPTPNDRNMERDPEKTVSALAP